MTNAEIAGVLEEIGILLELKGENTFKCRAYLNAARTIETCGEDVSVLIKEDRLGELPGIGEALQEKITTLATKGSLPYYDELKSSVPEGLLEMLKIPGLGPKKVGALYQELNIDSLEKLAQACRDHSISELTGFSEKSATKILEGIASLQTYANQHLYIEAIELGEELVAVLREHPQITRVALAGSLRRGKEVIKDVDLVASTKNPARVMDDFVHLDGVQKIVNHGETKSSIVIDGIACDLRVVTDREFASALHHFTGSKEHNIAMRQRAIDYGFKLNEYGLTDADGKVLHPESEEELFKLLELDFIQPELRENAGEIEAAATHCLPRLVEWTQLKGCFHNHTLASDGKNSLTEMADAAASIGLEYLGIADHSKSSVQAHGQSAERLLQQVAEIKRLNAERDDITLLAGVECDILKDGSLDFDDEVLSQLDYVVASVHSSFNLDEKAMTRRIIKAMENEFVTMLGHLTGRLLLRREPYQVNVAKVIEAAAKTGTWLELNANPVRLDMDWRHWRAAKEKGVKCVINPDAHAVNQLGYLKPAVQIARKGWLETKDVINCLSLKEVKKLLK